jgi:hypothetical protein
MMGTDGGNVRQVSRMTYPLLAVHPVHVAGTRAYPAGKKQFLKRFQALFQLAGMIKFQI